MVTRDELRRRLWMDDTFVDFDHGLNAVVNRLREALGESPASPRFIETIPRRGYRFISAIEKDEPRRRDASASATPMPGEPIASKRFPSEGISSSHLFPRAPSSRISRQMRMVATCSQLKPM